MNAVALSCACARLDIGRNPPPPPPPPGPYFAMLLSCFVTKGSIFRVLTALHRFDCNVTVTVKHKPCTLNSQLPSNMLSSFSRGFENKYSSPRCANVRALNISLKAASPRIFLPQTHLTDRISSSVKQLCFRCKQFTVSVHVLTTKNFKYM
jgi:hypothetical protein